MGSPSVPTASGLLQGLPHGREESSGKPENILEHLTPQISLHPELRAGQGDCEPHLCVTIPSRESRGAKPALCKASREETALRGPTASPTHLPSTLFYLIMSTGWEFHEKSFKPYSQDLSKLLVLEIRSGFGGQRHSFVPFGTWVLHQPTWKPELIPGQWRDGEQLRILTSPCVWGVSGEAEIKRIPRLRTVRLLLVKRFYAVKVQFMAPLTGWGLRRSQRDSHNTQTSKFMWQPFSKIKLFARDHYGFHQWKKK